MRIEYTPSPTLKRFHEADDNRTAFVRAIRGPIGSGKSVGMCVEIMLRASKQRPHNGVRRSRWVVIRNTYRELVDTTIKTWFDWCPEHIGEWSAGNMTHTITQPLPDGTVMSLEVLFRALDRPGDVKKLLSLELTGGWINEVKEIPRAVLDMLQGRVGRYPAKKHGGPSWWGVIMDTNSPDEDHWYYNLCEVVRPENWKIFNQPSGMSAEAENIENLPPRYYENMSHGKDPEWVKVYVHGEYGFITDGMPVYPEFHDNLHVAKVPLEYQGGTLYLGADFGRTPAAVFGQMVNGQMQIIDELVTISSNATNFARLVGERLRGHYPKNVEIVATGDPAGENPGEQVDMTCIDIMQNARIPIDAAHTNNFTIRREAVSTSLIQLTMGGEPQLIISPNCSVLRKAMNGGYRYKRVQVSGEQYKQKPDKNKYSHVAEALQYLMLGAGKGYDVISSHSDVGKYKVQGALQ
ncbi:MAG: hypothetical protein ACWGQW_05560 [bacterium]